MSTSDTCGGPPQRGHHFHTCFQGCSTREPRNPVSEVRHATLPPTLPGTLTCTFVSPRPNGRPVKLPESARTPKTMCLMPVVQESVDPVRP